MKISRFSLGRMFFSMTAIAAGLGGLAWLFRTIHQHDLNMFVVAAVAMACGATIGSGLLAPFDRPILGAILGALPFLLLFLLFVFLLILQR